MKDDAVISAIEANEVYGKLKEGVHLAGYSFARACASLEWLLKDGRWKQCGRGFEDKGAFVNSINLAQLRTTVEQQARIERLLKEEAGASTRQVAKVLGLTEGALRKREKKAAEKYAPEDKKVNEIKDENSSAAEKYAPTELSGAAAAKAVARKETKLAAAQETVARREASRGAEPLADGMELRIGDCRQVLADVPDNSVPLILTDPPYGDEAEPLYAWLAQWAARVLIPGGSLICYTGQSRLNRDIKIFDEHLRYWWLLVMMHDQSQRLAGKFVIANYKPVLWYVKDSRRGRTLVPDILRSVAREKEAHDWGQGEGGVSSVIEHLTDPGELVVDPFAGTGTWGRICTQMGRRWLGADVIEGGAASVKADAESENGSATKMVAAE